MSVTTQFFHKVVGHLTHLHDTMQPSIMEAARYVADQIKQDKLVYAYGPGGHSNLGSQEIFFRAGGLMHINAILDEGTLLSGGALRSMAIERLPGYGGIVMKDSGIQEGDVMILINAYGINSATIDSALYAKENGINVIAVTSVRHAQATPEDHPARHPSKKNLYELADVVLDCHVPVGDAMVEIEGLAPKVAAISTFANAFLLNSLIAETVNLLVQEGIEPPIWMSGNMAGGDEANARFIGRFKHRIPAL